MTVTLRVDTTRFEAAMREVSANLTKWAARVSAVMARIMPRTPARSPGPGPLCIDGHMYARRRRARRRRG